MWGGVKEKTQKHKATKFQTNKQNTNSIKFCDLYSLEVVLLFGIL